MLPWEAGRSLGVVGLGGLGHVAVKFGKAFGLRVTVISTSPGKEREARESLKADDFVLSTDHKQMQVWKYIHVQ
jgi:cinnamyl-alcohol dehydrogenase